MLTLLAPAKLNLTLEVLSQRPDGFHEIRSIMQTINLCDSLQFKLSQSIEVKCDKPAWNLDKSLVSKVISLLKEETGCSKGVKIEINKIIPLASGLGGDSSDAATILRGLNKLWGLGLSEERLVDLAAELGSDVPFFLYGGTALAKGRGEWLTPLPPLPRTWVVLMMPHLPQLDKKTERLYRGLSDSLYTTGEITDRLLIALNRGEKLRASMLFNVFEGIAGDNFAGLEEYRQSFLKAGAKEVHLAGSGPALFSLTRDKFQAESISKHLKEEGLECYLVDTMRAKGGQDGG